jgi:hypothetical protein
MTREQATKLLNIYGKAWVTRDSDLITSIFTEDATYNDPHEPENIGREAIRSYWVSKVIGEQSDISFDLKSVWIDGDVVVAEWYAEFTDTKRKFRIKMQEVAIFTTKEDKFSSLREFYKTEKSNL